VPYAAGVMEVEAGKDLPIAYVIAGSSGRGLDHSPIGKVASLLAVLSIAADSVTAEETSRTSARSL
jgi:hypothetical protein